MRILVHLDRYAAESTFTSYSAPYEVTLAGIAGTLHASSSTVGDCLKAMSDIGLIGYQRLLPRREGGRVRKAKCYYLHPMGRDAVRRIKKAEAAVDALNQAVRA